MGIQIVGNGGVVADVDGTTFRALRTTPRPTDHGALGHYRLSANIPLVVTQAANGTLFSFRWADATRFCAIDRIRLSCLQTGAATATIFPRFEAFIARTFTVSDSVGTALTLTTNSFKKRTNMGTTLVTDIRKSAVAAGCTVGTRTLDADAILALSTQQTITTPNAALYQAEWLADVASGMHPEVLAQNEGLIIRGPTTVFGAAGTADLIVEVGWRELTAF